MHLCLRWVCHTFKIHSFDILEQYFSHIDQCVSVVSDQHVYLIYPRSDMHLYLYVRSDQHFLLGLFCCVYFRSNQCLYVVADQCDYIGSNQCLNIGFDHTVMSDQYFLLNQFGAFTLLLSLFGVFTLSLISVLMLSLVSVWSDQYFNFETDLCR